MKMITTYGRREDRFSGREEQGNQIMIHRREGGNRETEIRGMEGTSDNGIQGSREGNRKMR